nr:hypothetical protein Q903MT_gene4668 [Picea sitchensis]
MGFPRTPIKVRFSSIKTSSNEDSEGALPNRGRIFSQICSNETLCLRRTSDRSIPLQPAQLRTGRLTATLNLHQH